MVVIPDNAVDGNSPADLLLPLQTLLQGVNLLGEKTASSGDAGDDKDPGAAVLESSATAVGRIVAPVGAGLGGLAAIGAAIGSFASTSHDSVRIAALAGGAGVLATIVAGFVYIVTTDLRSRTRGTVSIYEARKEITLQFLREVLKATSAAQARADASKENGSAPPDPAAAIVALAAAGAKAQVLHIADQKVGHLAGIACDDKVTVRWVDEDGNGTWSDIGDVKILSYTF